VVDTIRIVDIVVVVVDEELVDSEILVYDVLFVLTIRVLETLEPK
jgi:hypothetical protein